MTPEERILSFCERLPRDMKLSPAHELLILEEIKAAGEECASLAEEACLDIGVTAIEAAGIVRRTRNAIAAAIRNGGKGKMNWTTESPTEPGYYWIRNYLRSLDPQWQQYEEIRTEPVIIVVNEDLTFQFATSETERERDELISAEWYGPIEPPD